MMPFSSGQFFGAFGSYNEAWWPLQVLLVALAAVVAGLALRGGARADRLAGRLLAALWVWTALAYHLLVFTGVTRAAYLFAALFLLQAALLARAARTGALEFGRPRGAALAAGLIVVAYALALYPLIGRALGHAYPESPTFGAPCPVVIFTFGVLLWTKRPPAAALLVVPTLWTVLALGAAVSFGMWEDLGLPVAALVAWSVRRARSAAPAAAADPSLAR